MSRYPRVDEPAEEDRERIRFVAGLQTWLFLGMGLTGILTVALIVTADRSNAGIDGMRAVSVVAPEAEQDPRPAAAIPLLGGIGAAIRDLAPTLFAPAPTADPLAATPQQPARPAAATAPAATAAPSASEPPVGGIPTSAPSTVSPSAAPGGSPPAAPAVIPPPSGPTPAPSSSATPAPPATPSVTPTPTATATPSPTPTATPTPSVTASPSATPGPTLALSTDRGATAIVTVTGLVPGDSLTRTITVQNSGGLSFKYTVSATQTASTLLWTDLTNGLQLTVKTTGGAVLYSGPLSGLGYLAGPSVLAPGAGETLRYVFDFPATAPNAFQGLLQDLTLVFDAVQFP